MRLGAVGALLWASDPHRRDSARVPISPALRLLRRLRSCFSGTASREAPASASLKALNGRQELRLVAVLLQPLHRRDDLVELVEVEAVVAAVVVDVLVQGVDGQLLAVHEDAPGLREDVVPELVVGHALLGGLPEQRLPELARQYSE